MLPTAFRRYQSNSTGHHVGKAWMWALANALRESELPSFNGYQVSGGRDWQLEWFGVLPECQVLVVMLSRSYFKSAACVAELMEACRIGKPMIPIYLEDVDISGYFLGTTPEQKKTANFIRKSISGNRVPPPDQGCQGHFQGLGAPDFNRNVAMLVKTIKSDFLK
jgi:hypothetical protein